MKNTCIYQVYKLHLKLIKIAEDPIMPNAKKILTVGDESLLKPIIQTTFETQIASRAINFIFVNNGVEALENLQADNTISLILTDVNMPQVDGLTLLSKLLELGRPYKAVVILENGDTSTFRRARTLGASDFITKPIHPTDLKLMIQKMISDYEEVQRLQNIQQDLAIAQHLQRDILPTGTEPFAKFKIDISGVMFPAPRIGADYFDYFALDDYRLAVIIADACGEGISACLQMAVVKTLFRMLVKRNLSCSFVMSEANALIACQNNTTFVTAFFGIIDFTDGTLTSCNAGHCTPYIIHRNGNVVSLGATDGVPLGLGEAKTEFAAYSEQTIYLDDGDCLYLYTNGVTEAMDPNHKLYGKERLVATLRQVADKPTNDITNAVSDSIHEFASNHQQLDDISMLAVRYAPQTRQE